MRKQEPILELEELKLTKSAKIFLNEIGKWSFFLSILGFIGITFLVLIAIFSTTIFSQIQELQTNSYPDNLGLYLTIVYLFFAVLLFFPNFYLFKFSKKMKSALAEKDNNVLAEALEMLKSHYKFIGVLSIIILSLYAVLIIFSIIAGPLF